MGDFFMNGLIFILSLLWTAGAFASGVNIAPDLASIVVTHQGAKVLIERNQNPENLVNPAYAKTSRECPPFCIQPINIAPGVESIGELELLDYLKAKEQGDSSVLVIDSRTPNWVEGGTIPGSINIPWTKLSPSAGADPFELAEIFTQQFGAIEQEGFWNYAEAKTLVLFCNGMWCGQSPTNIRTLLKFGYPAHKIKWYRGGMQNWENLGLTVVK
jgi:rhodanese-related sulfurtransferase